MDARSFGSVPARNLEIDDARSTIGVDLEDVCLASPVDTATAESTLNAAIVRATETTPAPKLSASSGRDRDKTISLEKRPQEQSWQRELAESLTSVDDLLREDLVSSEEALKLRALGESYRVRVPRYYAALIDRSDAGKMNCPVRKQAIPSPGEQDPELPQWAQEWSMQAFGRPNPWAADAIGDLAKLVAPRLTHRYGNRAILHLSSLCALYCRFCFRKSHLNDSERTLYDGSLAPALEYLRKTPDVRELILTGGDPLSLPDAWLLKFFSQLEEIPHLKHVRLHSRMAATLPSRLTPELAAACVGRSFVASLVSHFNHPRELSPLARARLRSMRMAGVPLYNQSVLLAGVNDSAETLYELFQELYELGVNPFYLHHPDWTPGTFDFRLPIARGLEIVDSLAGKLSGPALPRYVLDIPQGGGKVELDSRHVRCLKTHESQGLSGALYEVLPPLTRATNSSVARQIVLYAEFWASAKTPRN